MVTGGLLAQAWRPERHLAAWQQVAAAFAALLLAATAVEAVVPAPLGLAAMIALLWALHPARAALLVRPRDASPPLVIVAVILTALLMPIVTGEVAAHRAEAAAAAAGQPLGVVAFALGVPLVALVAAGRAPAGACPHGAPVRARCCWASRGSSLPASVTPSVWQPSRVGRRSWRWPSGRPGAGPAAGYVRPGSVKEGGGSAR